MRTCRIDHDVRFAAAARQEDKSGSSSPLEFHLGKTLFPTSFCLSELLFLCRDSTRGIVRVQRRKSSEKQNTRGLK